MTTTVAQCLTEARGYLMSDVDDVCNTLNTTVNNSVTSVVFATNDSKLLPTVASTFEMDLEVFYVTAMSTNTATVIRGFYGSTAASHTAGALIRIDPRFYDFRLLGHLNGELLDLSSPINGLFKQAHVDITYNGSAVSYDLTSTTTVEDILDVRSRLSDSSKAWPRPNFELMRDTYTTDFASGNAIKFLGGGGQPGQIVRVWYKAPYSAVSATTDTLDTTAGVHAEACDIPAIGVAVRAMSGREVARNFTNSQGDTRRAAEVGAGAVNASSAGLRQLRQTRIQAEAARLASRWPGFGRFT